MNGQLALFAIECRECGEAHDSPWRSWRCLSWIFRYCTS